MLRFLALRLVRAALTIALVVTFAFAVLRLSGDPALTIMSPEAPAEAIAAFRKAWGLDQPLWRQYLTYLGHLASGDLGPSFKYANRTVNEIIADKLPVSLELGLEALAIALLIGLPLGVLAALHRNTWVDYVCSTIGLVGVCVPTFVMGPLLALGFGIYLKWYAPEDRVLPALTLGFVYAAYLMRLTRGGMLEVLHQDFIRTARAKGASQSRIIFHHALRGGLLPVVSFLGPAVAGILTGSFVIETIFQIPGLGREFVNSAFNRDYTLVLGTVILYAGLIVVLNLVVDVVQVWLNPRLKFE